VPLDYSKAVFWLRNAADRNDSRAQLNLGWAYESGLGIPRDTEQAIGWYRRAADAGEPQARARLEGLTGKPLWKYFLRHIGLFGLINDVIAQISEWLWRTA
jgi:TPR repeat protein